MHLKGKRGKKEQEEEGPVDPDVARFRAELAKRRAAAKPVTKRKPTRRMQDIMIGKGKRGV